MRAAIYWLSAVLPLVLASNLVSAHDYSINLGESNFGHVSQKLVCGFEASACGPTAAVNSFVFLQNSYSQFDGLIPESAEPAKMLQNEISVAQDLAKNYMHTNKEATTIDNFTLGKEGYIHDHGGGSAEFSAEADPRLFTNGKSTDPDTTVTAPTALFLAEQLADGEDVELLANQSDGMGGFKALGHFVTVVDLKWNDRNGNKLIDGTEGAKLGFIDPNGGVFKDNRELFEKNGDLFLNNPAGVTFEITAVVSESPFRKHNPIAEPAAFHIFAPAVLAFAVPNLMRRVRKRSKPRDRRIGLISAKANPDSRRASRTGASTHTRNSHI